MSLKGKIALLIILNHSVHTRRLLTICAIVVVVLFFRVPDPPERGKKTPFIYLQYFYRHPSVPRKGSHGDAEDGDQTQDKVDDESGQEAEEDRHDDGQALELANTRELATERFILPVWSCHT